MNKLNDMIFNASKLAAQKPQPDDAMAWNSHAMADAFEAWVGSTVDITASALLIDMPVRGLDARRKATAGTTVIWSARSDPADHTAVQGWQYSTRLPTDLSHSDQELWQSVTKASSLIEMQRALLSGPDGAPWIASRNTAQVQAPFLLNSLADEQLGLSLKEVARVLTLDGRFESIVLAADEPIADACITFDGMELTSFPCKADLSDLLLGAGLHGIKFKPLLDRPFMTVAGGELRAFSLSAHIGTKGVCLEQGDAAMYLGPWSRVFDDDGHEYPRGVRIAVCAKTAAVLQRAPYAGSFAIIQAYDRPDIEEAQLFDCSQVVIRPVAQTKGLAPLCGPGMTPLNCADGDCDC